jgi:GNAT superfamily N-acetyltransferase
MRLAAIADSPSTFATTLAVARARPAHHWDRVAEAGSSGGDQAPWFAEHGGEPAGMINAYRAGGGTVTVTSLWAAPGHRHLGVADVLVGRALEWAGEHGAARVRLWVVERNDEARDFYRRWGFRPTGREIKYEPDPRMIEIELQREVSPSDRGDG